jgi:hypothetical protein
MSTKLAPAGLAVLIAATSGGNLAVAEEHAEEALKHANDAADSVGDSRMIRQHALEALKHIEAAKEANAQRPEVIEQLEKGEAELRKAVEHASHYNANTARDTASDARSHIESAHSAAEAAPNK